MKKIIAMAVTAITMLSATFALNLELGGRGYLGTNFNNESTSTEMANQVKQINLNSNLDYGFGAFANISVFGPLGVLGELDLTKGTTSINSALDNKTQSYEVWTLDVPLMAWANFGNRFVLGLGAGVNFSFDLQSGSLTDLYNQTKKNASDNLFRTGFVAGTDVRIYLTEHFGLVASGRFIMDFDKKEVPVTVYGKDTGESYPTIEFSRRSLYGGIGCVVKLF